jgi:hypothetical protein
LVYPPPPKLNSPGGAGPPRRSGRGTSCPAGFAGAPASPLGAHAVAAGVASSSSPARGRCLSHEPARDAGVQRLLRLARIPGLRVPARARGRAAPLLPRVPLREALAPLPRARARARASAGLDRKRSAQTAAAADRERIEDALERARVEARDDLPQADLFSAFQSSYAMATSSDSPPDIVSASARRPLQSKSSSWTNGSTRFERRRLPAPLRCLRGRRTEGAAARGIGALEGLSLRGAFFVAPTEARTRCRCSRRC